MSKLFADLAAGGAASSHGVSFDLVVSAVRRRRMLQAALGLGSDTDVTHSNRNTSKPVAKDSEPEGNIDLSRFEIRAGLKQVVLQSRSRYDEARTIRRDEEEAVRRRARRAKRREARHKEQQKAAGAMSSGDGIGIDDVHASDSEGSDSSASSAGSLISLGDPVQKAKRDAAKK